MVKYSQTIRRQFVDELFECVWSFCGVGTLMVKDTFFCLNIDGNSKKLSLSFCNSQKIKKGILWFALYFVAWDLFFLAIIKYISDFQNLEDNDLVFVMKWLQS